MKHIAALTLSFLFLLSPSAFGQTDHLHFKGSGDGPGKGTHLVFLSGDEEYRSEEALPMMAQVLAKHHGFDCTVLFSLDDKGNVNPNSGGSLAHSEALDSADALIMSLRFRHWDDTSMQRFEKAMERGVPVVALRTSTHAFNFPKDSKWAKYSYNAGADTGWEKGFGRQVLGETWVNHHGRHKVEGTRSVVEEANKNHPILKGVGTIFGPTDVYGANPLQPTTILLRGAVTETLDPKSPNLKGPKNDPMQPMAWVREFKQPKTGKVNKIFTTTMGSSTDLVDENLRRLVANAVYWGLGLEVPEKADVTIPGSFKPSPYSFNAFKSGLKPADFILGAPNFDKAGPPKKEPIKKVDMKQKASKKNGKKNASQREKRRSSRSSYGVATRSDHADQPGVGCFSKKRRA